MSEQEQPRLFEIKQLLVGTHIQIASILTENLRLREMKDCKFQREGAQGVTWVTKSWLLE